MPRLKHWRRRSGWACLGLQCLLSTWVASTQAQATADSVLAIPPGSPPTALQQEFSHWPAGVRVFEAPEQTPVTDFAWIAHGDFALGYTDHIFMRGLVLSVQPYANVDEDDMAALSKMDMVIGWQRMSDPAIVSQIHIRQHARFYYWRVEQFPIPREEIERSSTNIHLIAAEPDVWGALTQVRPGDIVSLEGFLTDVRKPDGLIWNTSRVRDDHGDGACEILLLRHISVMSATRRPD